MEQTVTWTVFMRLATYYFTIVIVCCWAEHEVSRLPFHHRPELTLTVEPQELTSGSNQSVILRCLLSQIPTPEDSVYVIWRFRHSRQSPPPNNWAFMNQEDDIARCPEPPGSCELVNQYGKLKKGLAELNVASGASASDRDRIAQRRLHTLRIRQITWRYDGTFQCYVLLNLDALEARTSLRVLSAPKNPTIIYMIRETVERNIRTTVQNNDLDKIPHNKWQLTAGRFYHFVCLVAEANPQSHVTWIVRRRDGTFRALRMNYSVEGSFTNWWPFDTYLDLKRSDDLNYLDDGGSIECHAENVVGKAISARATLDLNYPPVIQGFPNSVVRVLENRNLSLNCVVLAKPPARVEWVDNAEQILSNSSYLILQHVTRMSPSEFTCIARNQIGKTKRGFKLDLLYPPIVQVRPNITANAGERLEVACRVDANPPAQTVYWSFTPDRKRESTSSHYREFSPGKKLGNQLLLAGVRRDHEGLYTCHALTEADLSKLLNSDKFEQVSIAETDYHWWKSKAIASASVRLVVNYAPGQPTVTILSRRPVLEGSLVRIQCSANNQEPGFPSPHFHWIRRSLSELITNTQLVIQSPAIQLEPQNQGSTLRINESTVTDSGMYTCYARNFAGISTPSTVVLSVLGKPRVMEGPPATLTFFANPLFVAGPKDVPSYEHYKPESSSETEFNQRQITNKQSFPSITLNCSFVTTTQTTVQWLFQPRADGSQPWSVIEPEKAGNSSSIVPDYQLETQATLLSEVNLWHIRSVLTIPQTPSWPLWEMNRVNKCTVEHAANLLQRERMEATYRCEATNAYGRTERTSNVSVVYSPLPLGCQDQFIGVPAQEIDQPVGPIFCQFSSRPPIEKVIWWQYRRNRLEKIYQSDKLIHPIELQDNAEFLIISGSPALLPDILSKNHSPSGLHILESMKNAWNSEHTFFTALWIKHFSPSNATLYQCEVTSAVGNRSVSRSITVPSQPHKVVNLQVHGITWTTVHLSWTPGFHGLQIPVTSPFLRVHNLTGVSMDLTRHSLETLYNRQLREILEAQHFLILLDDHGYRAQTGAVTGQAKLSASWSELSLPQDELINKTNQIRLRIGSSDHVNLTGLLPSHMYTVSVRGENFLGEGSVSTPIRFTTPDIVVHNPERIIVDRTSSTIRLSADNPAMCARIESVIPSSGIWLPVKFSNSEYVVQTADGQYTTNYPNGLRRDATYCLRLMWNSELEIPIKQESSYRIKYCHIGNPSECSVFVYPSKDLPTMVLFAVGGACILAVFILLALLTRFTWSHLKRRETKPNCLITDQQLRSPNDQINGAWMSPSSEMENHAEDTELLEQIAPFLKEIHPTLSSGDRTCFTGKRVYHHCYPVEAGILFD